MRWQEETQLLPEEMWRTLAAMLVDEQVWLGRLDLRSGVDERLQEGLTVYAIDQAQVKRDMRDMFRNICGDIAHTAGGPLGPEWGPTNSDIVADVDGFRPSDVVTREWEEYEDLE